MLSSFARRARRGLMALMLVASVWGSGGVCWAKPVNKGGARPLAPQPTPAPQPAPAPAAPVVASPASQLLERLSASKAQLEGVRQRRDDASGERREVIGAELLEVGSRYRRQLVDAATAVAGAEAPEGSAEEKNALRALLRDELRAQFPAVSRELSEYGQALTARSEELAQAKPADAAALATRRDRAREAVTTLLGEASETLTARALLGDDTAADTAELKKQLAESARSTSVALASTRDEADRLERDAAEPPTAEQQAKLDAVLDHQAQLAASQRKVIALMDNQGLDTVQLRRELISTTRQLSHDILDTQVLGGLFVEWKSGAAHWLAGHASAIAFRIGSCLLVLLVFSGLARFGRALVRRAISRAKGNLSSLASAFLVATSGRVIWLLGLVIAAAQLGIEVAPLIAGLGIAGFVAGFALQDTLSNFASGLMILVYRPFDVGDLIEAGGAVGAVRTMTLVYTSVLTPDNQVLIIPNNKIWGGVIRNVTTQAERRIDLEFRVSYSDDIDRAVSLLSSVLSDNPRVLAEPAPLVRLHELGDSCAKLVVRPWVKTGDYWDAYWEITREVKRRFDADGFAVPFPQQDLHLHNDGVEERTRRDSQIAPALAASG